MPNKHRGITGGILSGIGIGICVSGACTLIGAMILAWLLSAERLSEEAVHAGSMLIQALSSAIGCIIGWARVRQRRLLMTLLTMIGYCILLMLAGLALGGVQSGVGTTAGMIVVGGGISCVPAFFSGKGGAKRAKISAYR